MNRIWSLLVALALLGSACGGESVGTQGESQFGPAPQVPTGDPADETATALADLVASLEGEIDSSAIARLGDSDDARLAWFLTDLQRFLPMDSSAASETRVALRKLTGVVTEPVQSYSTTVDHLIAWDLPAYSGYREDKGVLFSLVEPGWEPFFEDGSSDLDHRLLQWGGVFIDARPLGAPDPVTGLATSGEVAAQPGELCPRGCIPALDDPGVTDAAGGDWYPDEAIVFGVVAGGAARAYPKNIMEVHEMVNDTLGGQRLGMPYCTLCGSAQVYLTGGVDDGRDLVLRTSGLLTRSNKVMYEFGTSSVFDTFTGRAVSGPLQGLQLEQLSTVVTSWGDWKEEHPETTIVAEDGGIGREYPADPLAGRDDSGPIFPIGEVDQRLGVQEPVLGVDAGGEFIAFPVVDATLALQAGEEVSVGDVHLELDGGGLRAFGNEGEPLVGHQSFWFAWSQFHPETALWNR